MLIISNDKQNEYSNSVVTLSLIAEETDFFSYWGFNWKKFR